MTAYTDTTGREWQGCASAADVEAYVAQARWMAAAGIIPRSLREALCEHPERWGDVRAMLARGTK